MAESLLGQKLSTPIDFRGDGLKSKKMLGFTLFVGSIILLFTGGMSMGIYIPIFLIAVIYSAYKYINYLPILPSINGIVLFMMIMGIIFAYIMYKIFRNFFTYIIYMIKTTLNIEYYAWIKYIFNGWSRIFKRLFF
jgi:hypothetical protein